MADAPGAVPEPLRDRPDRPADAFPSNPWPLALVLLAVAVGVGYGWFGHWKRAAVAIGGAILLAGVLRLVLSREAAGLLVIRRKAFDVTAYLVMAVGIVVLALVVPPAR